MKILLITDQHFGVRNDNQTFQEIYKKYYSTVVIPFIKKYKIDNIICLGDTFDKRKSINFQSLDAAKEMWFEPLREMGVHMWMLVGNHDIYYKNTVQVNAPSLLLNEYKNITVIDTVGEIGFDDTSILMMPWICDDNMSEIMSAIKETEAKICMGHLELKGFMAHPGYLHEHGLDMSMFSKFDLVCSGHYHTKSSNGNINYLGNPYQLYWNDVYDDRGFHVLDTDTSKLKFYKNPYNTFEKIVYDDGAANLPELKNRFVKLIVQKKTDYNKFDNFVKSLYDEGVADLKIIEDLTVELSDLDEDVETEDTLTLLENYIQEIETDIDRGMITDIMKSLYQEARSTMNIYILLSQKSGGVYASATADGNKVVQMFKHEDDAERFRLWLEADGKDADLTVESTDLDTVVGNCKVFGYSYSIIDSDEFIIPA